MVGVFPVSPRPRDGIISADSAKAPESQQGVQFVRSIEDARSSQNSLNRCPQGKRGRVGVISFHLILAHRFADREFEIPGFQSGHAPKNLGDFGFARSKLAP